jgi:hypothetical protein
VRTALRLLELGSKHVEYFIEIKLPTGALSWMPAKLWAWIVVFGPLGCIAQHSIRRLDLLKFLCVTTLVWVMGTGQFSKSLFDLVCGGCSSHA